MCARARRERAQGGGGEEEVLREVMVGDRVLCCRGWDSARGGLAVFVSMSTSMVEWTVRLWASLFWVEFFVWEQEVAIQWIKKRWLMVMRTAIASRMRSEYALLMDNSIDRCHRIYLAMIMYVRI
jgi:hypothetical protein